MVAIFSRYTGFLTTDSEIVKKLFEEDKLKGD